MVDGAVRWSFCLDFILSTCDAKQPSRCVFVNMIQLFGFCMYEWVVRLRAEQKRPIDCTYASPHFEQGTCGSILERRRRRKNNNRTGTKRLELLETCLEVLCIDRQCLHMSNTRTKA